MATNVTFSGSSAEECETFLATVNREALANGKYLDERWITCYAASLLRGEALVFYENLDAKTKASWADIRTLFVNKYVRSQKQIPSPRCAPPAQLHIGSLRALKPPSNAALTPAAAPPIAVPQKGRIAVVRENQQKLYLSSQLISASEGLKICNSPSEAQIVSFAASGTDLFELHAGDISSKITLCVQWPYVDGDDWLGKTDYYACIKSSANKGSGIAQAKVWNISKDNSLLVRFSHVRGTCDLDPVGSGEILHLAQDANIHCGSGQGIGFRKARLVPSISPPSSAPSLPSRITPLRVGAFAAASFVLSASYSVHLTQPRRLFSSHVSFPTMATVNLTPPQEPLSWKHTPEEIRDKTNEIIRDGRKFLDTIAALPEDKCSFDSVFRALALHDAEFDTISEPLSFYQNVSPDSKLRDASNDAEKLLRDFGIESSMRLDVFQALKRAEKNIRSGGVTLTPEEERLMEKMLLDGKRAGLDLSDTEREKLLETKKKLSETCLEFSKNFNEEKGTISFTKEELKGVPEDVISGYAKSTSVGGQPDKYAVTFKTPDIFPIFKFASNPLTRQLASEAYENRLTQNVPLLKKAIDLRWEIAKMLGYETWADYIVEVKMIKTSPNVMQFLDNLVKKMKVIGEKDRAALLKMKEEELGDKADGKFYIWDYRYYDRLFIEKSLDLDEAKVKEYFPVDVVVPVILKIYQDLLGVSFVEITKDVDTWHPDVQVFQVWNKDPKSATDFLGYTYLDLFPRESKYGHAAVWPLISGFSKKDGSRNYPVTAMVANLAKPVPGKTATMRHDDVVTFFHEMGHVFHGLLSNVVFSRFHGTSVARDFVEAPSQMLENWCWEPEVLKMMSKHAETGERLSDDLIDKLIKSRYVNAGLYFLRQLFFGKFDMELHTKQVDKDYDQLWSEMRESISLVKSGPDYTAGPGTFAHITGGYDAGYYGYMYSLVFSADMYKTVFAGNPLSPESGKKYRDSILKPGGSRDEMNSLKEFLGREPNPDAFLESLEANQYKPATVPSSL